MFGTTEVCNGSNVSRHRFREAPQAKDKALMPTFPSRSAKEMRTHQQQSPDPRIVEGRRGALGKAAEKGGLFSFPK